MTLKFSKAAPADGHERVQRHLSKSQPHATSKGLLEMARRTEIELGEPIQIWSIQLDETDRDHVSVVARPGEWQYLVFENNEAIAGAHVNDKEGSEDVSAVSYGVMTPGLIGALNKVEELEELQDHDFEPRLLIAPSLHFAGLWLHNEEGDERSVVIPIPPSMLSIEHYQPITLAELEEAFREAAAEVRHQIEIAPGESAGSGGSVNPADAVHAAPAGFVRSPLNLTQLQEKAPAGGAANVQLPQFMQHQQQSNWCWSAVGTSVGLFYQTGNWTQCDTATGCLPGQNCCANPGPCNVYGYLDQSLTYTKSYNTWVSGTVSLSIIETQLQSGNPVCTRVAWSGGGAHFMAITGVNGNNITIQDSIYGTSTMAYSSYAGSYHSGGTWSSTYYCQKN